MNLVNKESYMKKIEKCVQEGDAKKIKSLQSKIIATNDPELIYNFAKSVKGADIDKLSEALLDLYYGENFDKNDWNYVYNFANNVKGVDIKKFEEKFVKMFYSNYYEIINFAANVKGVNVERLQKIVVNFVECEDNDYYLISSFAKKVKGANFDSLQDVILNCYSPKDIYEFAIENNKKANIELLQKRLIKLDDAEHMFKFARDVKGADVDKLYDKVCENGDIIYIHEFNLLFQKEKELENTL